MFLRATIIQDLSEYLMILKPYLWDLIRHRNYFAVNEQALLEWILREELFLVNLLSCRNHNHHQEPYRDLYDELKSTFPYPFSVFTAYHLRFPKLYDSDPELELAILNQNELWIRYYTHTPKYNQHV